MKLLLSAVIALSSVSVSAFEAIIDLGYGEFLGSGHVLNDNGEEGQFIAYANLAGNQWDETVVFGDSAYFYHYAFEFTEHGKFYVSITTHSYDLQKKVLSDEITYNGRGYCMSTQCHLYATSSEDEHFIEETFALVRETGHIYKLGSHTSNLGDGTYSHISWETQLKDVTHHHEEN